MEEGLCGCPGESEMRGWGDGVVKGCRAQVWLVMAAHWLPCTPTCFCG